MGFGKTVAKSLVVPPEQMGSSDDRSAPYMPTSHVCVDVVATIQAIVWATNTKRNPYQVLRTCIRPLGLCAHMDMPCRRRVPLVLCGTCDHPSSRIISP